MEWLFFYISNGIQRELLYFSAFVETCEHNFEYHLYDARDSSPDPSITIISPNYPWVRSLY